jgi:hypothetical protein
MFAALAEILARLHPDRCWGQRDEAAALDAGIAPEEGRRLAATIAARLDVATRFVPGEADEWCDYIYVLCLGRPPSVIDLREGGVGEATARADADLASDADAVADPDADDADPALDDLYLRLALSSVARVVGVQEVAMRLRQRDGQTVVTEDVRSGVFDPILLPRFRALVALLAETDLRHLDFGEMVEPPPGFDGAGYTERFGVQPTVANYLFSPRPVSSRITTLLP